MGEPGSGKTTAARQLFWLLASRFRAPGLPEDCIPVWLAFRDMEGKKFASLEKFLGREAGAAAGAKKAGKALLECGRPLLWILDGFDEIPSRQLQGKVAKSIRKLKENRRDDRFLVTSRYLGGKETVKLGLASLAGFQLRPLDDDAQGEFIVNYLEHGGVADVEGAAKELGGIIRGKERHSTEERRMARNPMLLSLICFLFAEDVRAEAADPAASEKAKEKNLPGDWDELHEKFLEEFLNRGLERLAGEESAYGTWDPNDDLTVPVATGILESVAWWMQGREDRVSQPVRLFPPKEPAPGDASKCIADEVKKALGDLGEDYQAAVPASPEKFLQLMREHIGLMCWRGEKPGNMGFLHLNIQDSLAANYAVRRGKDAELAQMFNEKPEDQREVVRLAVKRSGGKGNFRSGLFERLLRGSLDGTDDVFMGRLVEMVGEETVPAFVEAIKGEEDGWRQARLLAFVRKHWTKDLQKTMEDLKLVEQEETRWHTLEIQAEPPEEGDVWVEETTGICFLRVKKGKFTMGSGDDENDAFEREKPHEVEITQDYWLGKYPVTNGEYVRYLEARQAAGAEIDYPRYWNDPRFNGVNQPVVGVSWEEAVEFCRWLREQCGKAIWLPTEAEWEYGCRGGSKGKHCCGDSKKKLKKYSWFVENAGDNTHVVGVKRPNVWGFYDMHGNALEWCWDWNGEYGSGPEKDPSGPESGLSRVARGGCWFDDARYCRSADRNWYAPDTRSDDLGFRVVLSPVRRSGEPELKPGEGER